MPGTDKRGVSVEDQQASGQVFYRINRAHDGMSGTQLLILQDKFSLVILQCLPDRPGVSIDHYKNPV